MIHGDLCDKAPRWQDSVHEGYGVGDVREEPLHSEIVLCNHTQWDRWRLEKVSPTHMHMLIIEYTKASIGWESWSNSHFRHCTNTIWVVVAPYYIDGHWFFLLVDDMYVHTTFWLREAISYWWYATYVCYYKSKVLGMELGVSHKPPPLCVIIQVEAYGPHVLVWLLLGHGIKLFFFLSSSWR